MDTAGIASLATAMYDQNTQSAVSIRVARKALDAQQQQGDAAIQMLDAALKMAQDLAKAPGSLDVTG